MLDLKEYLKFRQCEEEDKHLFVSQFNFRKSIQNLGVPSFFLTKHMFTDEGLLLGSIICSNILSISLSIICF